MVVPISACRISGGQLFGFNISQRFFYKVVQASLFQSVCCGIFELLVQRVVWHPLLLFYMDKKFGLSSVLHWFNSSGFLHFSYGSGFHGNKDCSQAPYSRDGRTAPV